MTTVMNACRNLHRRRLFRQSRPGRLGRDPALQRHDAKELSGGEAETTNNRMELTGGDLGAEALKEPCAVELYTDSEYVMDGIIQVDPGLEEERLEDRRQEAGEERRLWQALDEANRRHQVTWHWVKGHAGHARTNAPTNLPAKAWRRSRKAGNGPLRSHRKRPSEEQLPGEVRRSTQS